MRIYNTVILIFLIPGYKFDLSVNASSNYSDTCDYSTSHYPCGDICLDYIFGICSCGDEVIGGWDGWKPVSKIEKYDAITKLIESELRLFDSD